MKDEGKISSFSSDVNEGFLSSKVGIKRRADDDIWWSPEGYEKQQRLGDIIGAENTFREAFTEDEPKTIEQDLLLG